MEEWLPVVGFENYYEVSNAGRVRRSGRAAATYPGRILQPVKGEANLLYVNLSVHMKISRRAVHHLVAEAFIGSRPPGYEIDHLDSDETNNVWSNLEWVTKAENIRRQFERMRSGLRPRKTGYQFPLERKIRQSQLMKESWLRRKQLV
jgi:hypothetical protein